MKIHRFYNLSGVLEPPVWEPGPKILGGPADALLVTILGASVEML
jgi:hypothetical protein